MTTLQDHFVRLVAPLGRPIACLLAAATLGGCALGAGGISRSAPTGAVPPLVATAAVRSPAQGKIQHVVIVIQENRSFDNLFHGFPGANYATSGLNSKGQTVNLHPVGLNAQYEIDHFVADFLAACDGGPSGQNCKMDGFDQERAYGNQLPPNPQYAYVRPRETALYHDVASQYVLADAMFASNIDSSFVSHQYIIAGQAGDAANVPSVKWGCGGGKFNDVDTLKMDRTLGPTEAPCFDYMTLADELDAKALSWRYYMPNLSSGNSAWNGFLAIKHIYRGPDWAADVRWPPARFLRDIKGGELATVTWVVPNGNSSDHPAPQGGGQHGPEWVGNVVNAIGESRYWNNTAVFIFWDEWGGWYDHVPPRYVDFDGLGFRVPMIVVSPYSRLGRVSHVEYEHGSILKFIEDTFGLARLSATDTRANSPAADCFDFTKPPRPFKPFHTRLHASDFIDAPPDLTPPDEF